MANEWLRLWHDMPTDPKWRTIARISKQPISLVQAVYLHLLVDASRNVTRGVTDVTVEDLASSLDVTEDEIQAILDVMQGRVLDGDQISGWERRQPKREDAGNYETGAKSAVERKREQREREKEKLKTPENSQSHDASQNVTLDKDKYKDKYKEIKEIDKSISRTRFQKPTKTDIHDFCEQEQIVIDADKFIDHYEANGWIVGKTKMKDWQATVRNWARRNNEFSPSKPRASPLKPERPKYTYTPSHLSDMKEIHGERLL